MKTSPIYTYILYLLLLVGCSRLPVQTEYVYNPSANFQVYRTFGWYKAEVPQPVAGGAGPQFSLLLDQNMKEAIASELVKDGLNPVAENPDLLVAYDVAVNSQQLADDGYTFPSGFGYGYSYWYGYRFRYSTEGVLNFRPVQNMPAGTVVVDVIDPDTNQLLWRGYSTTDLNPTAVDEERISYIIANIMSQFPPIPPKIQ